MRKMEGLRIDDSQGSEGASADTEIRKGLWDGVWVTAK